MIARKQSARRQGGAIVFALVVLAVIGVLMATAAQQITHARRMVENRRNLLQARWLVRSGIELAAARLVAASADYTGEDVEPIVDARVNIQVTKEGSDANSFRIRCTARFPIGEPFTVESSTTRIAKRTADGGRIELSSLSE